MQCPRCQQDNPAHARFCLGCGARLALACPACGTDLPAGARFCLQCGPPVTVPAAAPIALPGPAAYTPRHLAEKILVSKAALDQWTEPRPAALWWSTAAIEVSGRPQGHIRRDR